LTGFSDRKHLVHGWGDDPVAAPPEVPRMAVVQVGIVPFDAEPLKRQHILRESPGVEVVNLIDDSRAFPHGTRRTSRAASRKCGVYMFKAVGQFIYDGKVR